MLLVHLLRHRSAREEVHHSLNLLCYPCKHGLRMLTHLCLPFPQTLAVVKLLMGEGRLCAAAVQQCPASDCHQSMIIAAESISQYSGETGRAGDMLYLPGCKGLSIHRLAQSAACPSYRTALLFLTYVPCTLCIYLLSNPCANVIL